MDEAQTRLIVMLTHHDRTVENAPEVFEACRGTGAEYWGMKEEGLPPERMRALYRRMQECGKKTALEVVAYTEAEGLQGAQLAAGCGCDLLMGTLFFDSIAAFCRTHGLRYLPFVGRVRGRPSVLEGPPRRNAAAGPGLPGRLRLRPAGLPLYRRQNRADPALCGRGGRPGLRGGQHRRHGPAGGGQGGRPLGLHHRQRLF